MKTIDIYTFREWRKQRRADFQEPTSSNQRKAHCRVCGCELAKGTGIGYVELMSDFYRGSVRYVCGNCEELTDPDKCER